MANATIAFLAVWAIVGVISVPLGCAVERVIPKSGINHCVDSVGLYNHLLEYLLTHRIPRIQALTIIDIITEFFTALIPILGLYRNKMHVEDKAMVMVAFCTRIL